MGALPRLRNAAVWAICAAALAQCAPTRAANEVKGTKKIYSKDKAMTTANPPSTALPGPRRESVLPLSTSAAGKQAWSSALPQLATVDWPPQVVVWGDAVAVTSPLQIFLFDAKGKLLWSQEKQSGSRIALGNDRMYFKAKSTFLEAVDKAQVKTMQRGSFPGALADDVVVELFWPREKDFISVILRPGDMEAPEGDPDGPMIASETWAQKSEYNSSTGDELYQQRGETRLPPLFDPASQILSLFTTELIRINAADRKSQVKLPMPALDWSDWSVDAGEVYSLTGQTADGHKVLVAISATGKELWRWTDATLSDDWIRTQAPVRAPGGRVYVLTSGRVLAIEKGKLVWEFSALDAALKHGAKVEDGSFEIKDGRLLAKGSLRHATALSDGSLLVTGNKTLRHLGADGKQLFSVTLEEDILSEPTLDADGHIYVAGATRLMRID